MTNLPSGTGEIQRRRVYCKRSSRLRKEEMFVNWGLFCQIEVILLTIGLIVSFVITMQQNAKDNSFAKRVFALGKAFEEYGKGIAETHSKAKMTMLNDLVESMKKKEEKK